MSKLGIDFNAKIIDSSSANKILESFNGSWVYIKSVVSKVNGESLKDYISYYNKFRVSNIDLSSDIIYVWNRR